MKIVYFKSLCFLYLYCMKSGWIKTKKVTQWPKLKSLTTHPAFLSCFLLDCLSHSSLFLGIFSLSLVKLLKWNKLVGESNREVTEALLCVIASQRKKGDWNFSFNNNCLLPETPSVFMLRREEENEKKAKKKKKKRKEREEKEDTSSFPGDGCASFTFHAFMQLHTWRRRITHIQCLCHAWYTESRTRERHIP